MLGNPATARVDGAFVPARKAGVVAVDADVEAVLVDETTDLLHLVNSSGALLWACFDGESSVADICFDLAEELDVPFEQVLADTWRVVTELEAQGLVFDGRGPIPDRADDDHLDRDQSLDVPRHERLLEEPPGG